MEEGAQERLKGLRHTKVIMQPYVPIFMLISLAEISSLFHYLCHPSNLNLWIIALGKFSLRKFSPPPHIYSLPVPPPLHTHILTPSLVYEPLCTLLHHSKSTRTLFCGVTQRLNIRYLVMQILLSSTQSSGIMSAWLTHQVSKRNCPWLTEGACELTWASAYPHLQGWSTTNRQLIAPWRYSLPTTLQRPLQRTKSLAKNTHINLCFERAWPKTLQIALTSINNLAKIA